MAKAKKVDGGQPEFISDVVVAEATVSQESSSEPAEKVPAISSPEWSDFVLSKFQADELDELGNPRVDGLFRVAELLLGEAISGEGDLIEAANCNNGWSASAKYTLKFLKTATAPSYGQPLVVTFTGVADCSPRNADDQFCRYAAAMAETRAKGRALRTALRLRRVVSAEEVCPLPQDDATDEKVTTVQLDTIDLLCERAKVNAKALIAMIAAENNYEVKRISEIKRGLAKLCITKLNEYVRQASSVPEAVSGYVAKWNK